MKQWAFLAVALVLCSGARAETLEHPDAGVHIDVPAGWTHETQGDLLVMMSQADDVVLIGFVGSDKDAKSFIEHLDKEMEHLISHPKVTKGPRTETVNNLSQSYIEGVGTLLDADKWIPKGEKGGQSVDWDITLVTGAKATFVVIAFGKLNENQKVIDGVYRSIKK